MTVISEVLAIVRDIVIAFYDILCFRRKRRISHHIFIGSPRDVVWRTIMNSGTLYGGMPIRYDIDPIGGDDQLFRVSFGIDDDTIDCVVRVVETRDGEAYLAERLVADSHSRHSPGDDHFFGSILRDVEGGTELTHFDELQFDGFVQRILYPIFVRGILQRVKVTCEMEAKPQTEEKEKASLWGPVTAGLVSGFIWYLYDFNWALVFLSALLIHEYGHVLAMYLIGRPVKEVYWFPFLSGIEPDPSKFRTRLEKAFCSLMGPAFSLLPSLVLFAAYIWTENAIFGASAALFAVINLINLLPIFPLDGGYVLKAVARSVERESAVTAGWAGLVVGLVFAFTMQSYVIAAVVSFGVLQILNFVDEDEDRSMPLSKAGLVLIVGGTLLTAFLYGNILLTTMTDPQISILLGLA